jgi:murein DD-endopeptidase MepM/ murein hydrolase activator NlpD
VPLALVVIVAGLSAGAAAQEPPITADDLDAWTTRSKYFFDATRQPELRYEFQGTEPVDLEVDLVRRDSGTLLFTWPQPAAEPSTVHSLVWDGFKQDGTAGPNGRYRFVVRLPGAEDRLGRAGFSFYKHIFPVRGKHWSRGAIGEFGAPRSGGRRHIGYDVNAACGTPLVAARGGRVQKRGYRPDLDGHFLVIDGRQTETDYWYAHLQSPSWAEVGQRVATGMQIGRVGKTGNARTVGCHLHFELWSDGYPQGHPIDPGPSLRRWDGWS